MRVVFSSDTVNLTRCKMSSYFDRRVSVLRNWKIGENFSRKNEFSLNCNRLVTVKVKFTGVSQSGPNDGPRATFGLA